MAVDVAEYVGQTGAGEFTVEPWMAHLWADATSNPDDCFRHGAGDPADGRAAEEDCAANGRATDGRTPDDLVVPPTVIVHLAREATGMASVETELRANAGPGLEVFLGGQGITAQRPLRVNTVYRAEAAVQPVVEKSGASGNFSVLTVEYEVSQDDEVAFEAHTDLILRDAGGNA